MNRYNVHIRIIYLLMPVALFLMAAQPIPPGDKNAAKTTPYDFGMPALLLPVQAPAYNPTTVEGVALGRKLFYDPVLSGNQKQSCSSCHKQELAFTDGRQISVGSLGQNAHRNSMALVNLGWQDRYFWDGRALTLEAVIHFPVTDTQEMGGDTMEIEKRLNNNKEYKVLFRKAFGSSAITTLLVAKALSQFLRTIVSHDAPFDHVYQDYFYNNGPLMPANGGSYTNADALIYGLGKGNEEKYGHDSTLVKLIKQVSADNKVLTIFGTCITCHYNSVQLICNKCATVNQGSNFIAENQRVQYKNDGLETEGPDKGLYEQTKKEEDKYLYKVPTFRNLAFSAPYMHDGRFKTLEEVVEHYNSGIQPNQNLDSLLRDENNKPVRFNLTEDEKRQMVGLLRLFTDSSVLTDPRFSAPVQP